MSAELQKEIELEIAHILLIDVVGYSKLLVNEQIELLQQLNRIVRSTECLRAAESKGKLTRVPTGDGMALLFFRSPEQPAQCALEISQALKDYPHIELRMGVHSGPVNQVTDVNDSPNIAGAGINVAQRVMDCGDAGHILLSKRLADDLVEYRRWRPYLHDLGECEVKYGLRLHLVNLHKDNLGNPHLPEKLKRIRRWKRASGVSVRPVITRRWPKYVLTAVLLVSAVVLAISFSVFYRRGSPAVAHSSSGKAAAVGFPIPEKSIAVLPFENRSEDTANAYFADGIQDEIMTRLSKIADLKVISRTSTQHYKSAPENLSEIAKQLGVAHIVEGSVQKSGNAVRVNVQLIKAANDSHLWADTFDRKLTDIFSVESEVAKAIADQLSAQLTSRERKMIATRPTENLEAYDDYLRGLAYTLKTIPTYTNATNARRYFTEAVKLDPKFAVSWAMLSIVDSRNYLTQALAPTPALREEARQAAETALTLKPGLGEAIWAKGFYHYACLKDYDTAMTYFERARQLLPNNSRIPESMAYVERRRGRWEKSEQYLNDAERLDPRNVVLLAGHATSYMCLRRFPEALQKIEQSLNISPDDVGTIALKAKIAQAQGDLPRAAALLAPLRPGPTDASVIELQIYQGILERRPQEAIVQAQQIMPKPDAVPQSPGSSDVNVWLGNLTVWLAWAQEVAGDSGNARESYRRAQSELEKLLNKLGDNYGLLDDLALIYMGLGDKSKASAFAERAIASNPVEKDAVRGPLPVEILARVCARFRETDRAINALEKLLTLPYDGAMGVSAPLTPALLRLDPMFDSLRDNPRFQKLANSDFQKRP
jgi:TolB-like protein/class 3 adenylate cyclase/Tfp pilus assembly protein PilF